MNILRTQPQLISMNRGSRKSTDFTLLLAFGGVYILWGSTYLAMSVLIKTVPMFLMASTRFALAGSILLMWAYWAKHPFPSKKEAVRSCLLGGMLLVGGNGGVVVANTFISSSGIIAIMVAITPLLVAVLQWATGTSEKLPLSAWIGILVGIVGMIVLAGPGNLKSFGENSMWGILCILLSCTSWAFGTMYATKGNLPTSPLVNSGIQMWFASICMLVFATFHGEWNTVSLPSYGWKEGLSFLYLVVGGSVLGFTSYTYLARNASPSSASTYAYVNPVIALFLGWWIGHEEISQQTIVASSLLVGGVALIVMKPKFK